jgi:hypothetical protein
VKQIIITSERNINAEKITVKRKSRIEDLKLFQNELTPTNTLGEEKIDKNFKKFQKSVGNIYNMDTNQFIKFSEFFNNKSEDGQFIGIFLVKKLMYSCAKNRKNVIATEKEIDHTLELIKSYDSKLDFEEFAAFMTLFFANKNNLEKRMESFLKSRDYKQTNFLSVTQAYEKVFFLFRFYNLVNNNMDMIYRFFKFDEDIQFDEFISRVYPFLKSRLFVKWSE